MIRATLTGDQFASAEGITCSGHISPVIALSRELIRAGHDPSEPMQCWRGPTLCLRIRSIGEAASLRVATKGTDFCALEPNAAVTTAPPVALDGDGAQVPVEPLGVTIAPPGGVL